MTVQLNVTPYKTHTHTHGGKTGSEGEKKNEEGGCRCDVSVPLLQDETSAKGSPEVSRSEEKALMRCFKKKTTFICD